MFHNKQSPGIYLYDHMEIGVTSEASLIEKNHPLLSCQKTHIHVKISMLIPLYSFKAGYIDK